MLPAFPAAPQTFAILEHLNDSSADCATVALEAGTDEYLSKPVSLKRLIGAIEVQLSRNRTEKDGVT